MMWSLLVLLLAALACAFAGWPIWRGSGDSEFAADPGSDEWVGIQDEADAVAERWSQAAGDMNAS